MSGTIAGRDREDCSWQAGMKRRLTAGQFGLLDPGLGIGNGGLEARVGDDGEGLVADFLGFGETVVANEDFHKGANAGDEIVGEHEAIIHMLLNIRGKIRDSRSGQVHRLRQWWRGGGPVPGIRIGCIGAVLIPLLLA